MQYNFANRMGNLQASAIREILKFTSDPEVISLAAGNPSSEAIPTETIRSLSDNILNKTPVLALQYGVTEGYAPLKESIKRVMLSREKIVHENDDIVIMSGAQQGVELTCKVFCNENDAVISENPSFIGSLNAFKSYTKNVIGVDMDVDGIKIDKLEESIKANPSAKLLYLIPNFQNPTGHTMSLEKRKAVYELAKKYGLIIIEDNPYGDLRFSGEHIPSIKSMDTEGIVVYCGSFSKVLSPGIRVGFVVANREILNKIVVCKQVSDVHTNLLSQMICNDFLNTVDYSEHIKKLQKIYKHKCDTMLDEMDVCFNKSFKYERPEGGLFVWCDLPENIDMNEFCKLAIKNKVAVVPGSAFMPNDTCHTNSIRLNYSTPSDEDIIKGIRILGELTQKF